jgi:hypothetical protein
VTADPSTGRNPAPATGRYATARGLHALSVVIPVFNEERWIRICLDAVHAAGAAAQLPLDVVVVDDGSTDATPAVLAELEASTGIRVIRQANAGRLAARAAGVAAATEPWILLLDSRVVIEPDALRWLRAHREEHPDRYVWNGHIDTVTKGNMFAAFWAGLVKIGWRRYTANPRLVSFGPDDFDAYPKGTTGLLIPKQLFVKEAGAFTSMFDNENLSSDDTRLLRGVAARERIWIAPTFAFQYHGKSGLRKFARQAYFRGTTFVDGYLGQAGVIRQALIAAIVGGCAVLALLVLFPLVGLACVVAGLVAAPVVVRLVGGSFGEVRAVALLTPVFIPIFGFGVLRGLWLAARGRLSARRA